jgi:hypothetical protein
VTTLDGGGRVGPGLGQPHRVQPLIDPNRVDRPSVEARTTSA